MTDAHLDRRGFLALGVGALAVAVTPGLVRPQERLVRRTFPVMGTLGEIAVPARHQAGARQAITAAIAELDRIEKLMSRFRTDSDVGRLNASTQGRAVAVSPETAEVVRDALAWAADSRGTFDPCLGRLSELWDPAQGARPPSRDVQRSFADQSLWRALEAEGTPDAPVLRRGRTEAALDLGGIAKGYGVDRAVATLRDFGVFRGLVNVGGDLMAMGVGARGEPWKVGVRNPARPEAIIETLDVEDEALATSGDYLRYFEYGGRRYHHLLDPATGAPYQSALHTITVRAPDVRTADAAATAAFALGGASPSPASSRRSGIRIVHRG